MPDRNKVIDGLKELCEYLFHEYKVCYHGDEEDTYNRFLVANNALELLKEQEPVEPERRFIRPERHFDTYRCHGCDFMHLRFGQQFCGGCGRRVKWDADT